MRFNLKCLTDNGEIDLKINAECEEDAEAIALTKYNIKEVITISTNTHLNKNNLIYDNMKRSEYPYIKNTGKSSVRIFT
jgi:hypothetical protein